MTDVADQGWILGNSGLIYEDLQRGTKVDRDAYQALPAEARRLVAQGTPVVHGRADYTARVKWTPAGWAILNWAVELQRLAPPGVSATTVSVQGGQTAEAIFRSARTGQTVEMPFEALECDDR